MLLGKGCLPSSIAQYGSCAAAPWRITGARHAGITVSDLDRSLAFYGGQLGLELLWRRLYEEPETRGIVGVPEATAFDIALLRVPGSDLELELIEYKGCERRSGAAGRRTSEPATSASSLTASTSSTPTCRRGRPLPLGRGPSR